MSRDRGSKQDLVAALESAGAKFRGMQCTCPFHPDTDPSGSVFQSAGVWRFKCFSGPCTPKAMDVFDVMAKSSGKALKDVLPNSGGHASGSARQNYTKPAPPAEKPKEPEKPEPPPKIAAPTAQDLTDKVRRGAIAKGNKLEDVYAYTDVNGETIEMVYRIRMASGKKTFIQGSSRPEGWCFSAPPKPWPLFNILAALAADTVIVVEGEKCAIALDRCGYAVTTSPGGAKNGQNADWSLLAGKTVVLWPDNDEPGIAHMHGIAAILAKQEPFCDVFWVDPSALGLGDAEDAADFVARLPEDADIAATIGSIVSGAREIGGYGDLIQEMEDTILGKRYAVPFPFPELTRQTQALLPGTVTILAGSPGASKSFGVLQCLQAWHAAGIKTSMYALEDDVPFQLRRVLAQVSEQSSITNSEWVREHGVEAMKALRANAEMLRGLQRRIESKDGKKRVFFADALAWAEEKARRGSRIIIMDPVTILAARDERSKNNESEDFMEGILGCASHYGCSFILTIHPKKGERDANGFVALDDIQGVAAYTRFAQTVLWLHFYPEEVMADCRGLRPGEVSPRRINRHFYIPKARNGIGTGRAIGYQFNGDNLTLEEQGLMIGPAKKGTAPTEEDYGQAARDAMKKKRTGEQQDFNEGRGHDQ